MSDEPVEMCACGRPLHYTDKSIEAMMKTMSRTLGENVCVAVAGDAVYLVQRHYIALHGVKARELPDLLARCIVTRVQNGDVE